MGLVTLRTDPSPRELVHFGLLFLAFFAIVGGVVWHRTGSPGAAIAVWGIAGAVGALYFAVPAVRRPLYVGWMVAAYPIGWTVSHLVLAVLYFLVLTPLGLLLRLFGYDPMQRRRDPAAPSYWQRHDPGRDPRRYFKPF